MSVFLVEVQYAGNINWVLMPDAHPMYSRHGANIIRDLYQAGIDLKATPYQAVRVSEFQRIEVK